MATTWADGKVTRAAIYCRISNDKEKLKKGVKRQEADCLKLVEPDWIISKYTDNHRTAADPNKPRPEYDRMMADLKNIDVVLVSSEDRLHRQPMELEEFVAAARAAGMERLISVKSGSTDLSDSDAVMILRIKGSVAANEVDKIRWRVTNKHRELAEAGEYAGSHRPYGYRIVTKEEARFNSREAGLFIDEAEAVYVKEAARRVLDGESLRSIVANFNQRGIKPTKSDQWRRSSLREMLIRPLITGLRQHGKDENGDPIIVGEAQWEGIIDRSEWQQIKDILTNPERTVPRPSRQYPLKGILKCGECGGFLTATPRKRHKDAPSERFYSCRKNLGGCGHVWAKSDPLEEYVFGIALPMADNPGLRDLISKAEAGTDEERARLIHENALDLEMLSQLDDDYGDRAIPRQTFLKQSQRLRDRIEGRTAQIASMRAYNALDRLGSQVQEHWTEMTADEQRMIMDTLFKEIIVIKARPGAPRNRFDDSRVVLIGRWLPLQYKEPKPWTDVPWWDFVDYRSAMADHDRAI